MPFNTCIVPNKGTQKNVEDKLDVQKALKKDSKSSIVKKIKQTVSPTLQYTIPFLSPILGSSDEMNSRDLETAIYDMNDILNDSKKSKYTINGKHNNKNNHNDDEEDDDEEDTATITVDTIPTRNICDILASVSLSSGIINLKKTDKFKKNDTNKTESSQESSFNDLLEEEESNSENLTNDSEIIGNYSNLSSPTFPQSPIHSPSTTELNEMNSPQINDTMEEYFSSENLTDFDESAELERKSSNSTEFNDSSSYNISEKDSNLVKSILENLNPNILNDTMFMKVNDSNNTEYSNLENKDTICKIKLNIARKLQDLFNLDDNDTFYENFDGWLVGDVLLQGHFCLMENSLLFYAFIPNWYSSTVNDYSTYDPHRIIQSGSLGMKTAKYGDSVFNSMITHRYWAVLRRGNLCIYSSWTENYFPTNIIDLKQCIKAEIIESNTSKPQNPVDSENKIKISRLSKDNPDSDIYEAMEESGIEDEDIEFTTGGVWFKIIGKNKTYKFYTDSIYLARQWCNNLTKLIFSINNSNVDNEVLVKIPIKNIVDFKRTVLFSSERENENTKEKNQKELPSVLSIKYLRNNEIQRGRNASNFQKIVKETSKSNKNNASSNLLLDDIHFIFFANGNKVNKIFSDVTCKHFETIDWYSKDKEDRLNQLYKRNNNYIHEENSKNCGLSTLQLFKESNIINKIMHVNAHLEEDFGENAQEKEKFFNIITKGISLPKIFINSKKNIDEKIIGDTIKSESEHSPNSQSSPEILNLPKTVSISNIQDLQMSLEATRKEFKKMESEYNKRHLNSFKVSEKNHSTISNRNTIPNRFSKKEINENDKKKSKQGKLKYLGKSLNVISNAGEFLFNPSHYEEVQANDNLFIKNDESRITATINFHKHFSLTNSNLIASYQVNLLRGIPVYGKLYIGETELCFRSLLPGISTKMILPLMDLEICKKEKGSKLGCSGLVLIVRGSENITLEFNLSKARDDCEMVILRQLQKMRQLCSRSSEVLNIEQSVTELTEISRIDKARMKLFEDRFSTVSGLDVPMILGDSPFFKIEVKTTISLKFTLLTIGSRGDVQPYIALGKALIKEGHHVTIATHGEFKDWILSHDLNFKEIAGNPVNLMSLMVTHGSMSVSFLKEANLKFRSWISELLTTSWKAAQGSDIIIESPSAMAGIHIAEALSIPYMRAFTMPWTRTRAYPHAFIVPEQNRGGTYNYMTHVMFETVFWKGISGQVNKWRVEQLGLPKTNLSKLRQSRVPFLYNVSPTIFPPSVDFPDWVRVTGYWFLDEGSAKNYEPPNELVEFIKLARNEKKKVVYIGFGSIVVEDAESLTKSIVDAVIDADVRCILNKGWSDRLSDENKKPVTKLPPVVYDCPAIPHDWLFTQIDAAVHHGGSGSTGASMRAGLPTIIKPFFGDQFFYASRVEAIGAGLALKKLNAKSLSKALLTVTTDEKMREKARDIGKRIRDENGVLCAIESIYLELEYARTLILSNQKNSIGDSQNNTFTTLNSSLNEANNSF